MYFCRLTLQDFDKAKNRFVPNHLFDKVDMLEIRKLQGHYIIL
jgi:hypothetical protein